MLSGRFCKDLQSINICVIPLIIQESSNDLQRKRVPLASLRYSFGELFCSQSISVSFRLSYKKAPRISRERGCPLQASAILLESSS
ncbi:hypothetical protein SUGI_0427230 [Cryptomeria japonica]|nr:hypothetical protein SUGI_0427230 [Cryptomeria japonica]